MLVYNNKNNGHEKARDKYLNNLIENGLELKVKKDHEKLTFILVKIPFEKCLEIAEKVKFKMPIEINDLEKEESENFGLNSFWKRFDSLVPEEVSKYKKRKYFTAPYSSNLRKKLV